LQSLAVLLALLAALTTLAWSVLLATLLLLTRLLVRTLILVFVLRHFRFPSNVGWPAVSKLTFWTCRPVKTTPSE
jgi:antibiotic biosynthesis monooxygenase (ABM) superfamily enzyme